MNGTTGEMTVWKVTFGLHKEEVHEDCHDQDADCKEKEPAAAAEVF